MFLFLCFHCTTHSRYNLVVFFVIEQPPEPVNVMPELKGAGPKIKTRDGSKVHLKELIKSKGNLLLVTLVDTFCSTRN